MPVGSRGRATRQLTYKEAVYDVELDHSDLHEGETRAGQMCPLCNGGPDGKATFSVSKRDGVLLFFCHRVSCPFRGTTSRTSRAGEGDRQSRSSSPQYFPPTRELDEESYQLLSDRFGLTRESLGFAGVRRVEGARRNYTGRICFPIYGPDLRERGASYRTYEDGVEPKALVLMREGQLKAGWYKFLRRCDTLVIVEDPVSAIKLAPHFHSLALFGTHISDQVADEVVAGRYKRVWLALDEDATKQSIRQVLRLRRRVGGIKVYPLSVDIKDMSDETFNHTVEELDKYDG